MNAAFDTPDGRKFKLDHAVASLMRERAQIRPGATEVGGVLLGRIIHATHDIVVDEVTAPFPSDRGTRTSFFRSRAPHQAAIDAAYARSQGTCLYLGEWHTHPEPFPEPSGIDQDDWKRRLREDLVDATHLFFVIVGTETLRAWQGSRATGTIVALHAAGEGVRKR